MDQNSDAWLEWRKKGIGASDAPIILGVSPWKTPHQLWEDKMGFTKSVGNFATQRGHDLEPKARAAFELWAGKEFPPKLAEHSQMGFLRASLDGYNEEENAILEIKCPGAEDHAKAKNGEIPDKYYPQLQHQFMVTGAVTGWYFSFDGEKGHVVEVKPNPKYIEETLFPKLSEFYNEYMVKKVAPPLTDRDQIQIEDKEMLDLADEYCKKDAEIKALKKDLDGIKRTFTKKISHPRARIGGVTFTRVTRAGNIDFSKVPELEGVDVEKYRKDPTSSVTLRVSKKGE